MALSPCLLCKYPLVCEGQHVASCLCVCVCRYNEREVATWGIVFNKLREKVSFPLHKRPPSGPLFRLHMSSLILRGVLMAVSLLASYTLPRHLPIVLACSAQANKYSCKEYHNLIAQMEQHCGQKAKHFSRPSPHTRSTCMYLPICRTMHILIMFVHMFRQRHRFAHNSLHMHTSAHVQIL